MNHSSRGLELLRPFVDRDDDDLVDGVVVVAAVALVVVARALLVVVLCDTVAAYGPKNIPKER